MQPGDDTMLLPTGFLPLDMVTGGGLGLGEATLVIAPPGLGKTILACQLGSTMAISGTRVLHISTEETNRQLEPRIVACHCNVPISLIKDGVKEKLMQRDQLERYQNLRRELSPERFRIVNWDDRSKDIEGGYEALMEAAAKAMGGMPQVVLLDWLGGALGRNASNDPAVFRMILKRGANAQAAAAKRYGIHTITFAQADLKQSIGKIRVDATVLSECKTLDEPMTNVWGITGILHPQAEVDSHTQSAVFREQQYIYVSKARHRADVQIPVHRDFLFQRFLPGKICGSNSFL